MTQSPITWRSTLSPANGLNISIVQDTGYTPLSLSRHLYVSTQRLSSTISVEDIDLHTGTMPIVLSTYFNSNFPHQPSYSEKYATFLDFYEERSLLYLHYCIIKRLSSNHYKLEETRKKNPSIICKLQLASGGAQIPCYIILWQTFKVTISSEIRV